MGQTLSEPVTAKETAVCQDDNYKVSNSAILCISGERFKLRCYFKNTCITNFNQFINHVFVLLGGK